VTLSPRQIDRFYTDGYLMIEDALTEADLAPVIREYDERIDRRARELHAAGKLSHLYEEEPFERRLACICRETMEMYPEMDIMHHRGKAAFEFLRNERLLNLVEGFVGPEITCSPIQHIRAKLPAALTPELQGKGDTHVAPWHQDAGVTWAEADPHFILTVWLPLVDATPENGCMEVLPGMVGTGLLPHHSKAGVGTTIIPEQLPEIEPIALPIKKGGVIFMHTQPDRHRPLEHRPPLPEDRHSNRKAVPPRIRRPQPRQPRHGPYRPRGMVPDVGGGSGMREGGGRFSAPLGEGGVNCARGAERS
jgi:hypothetical protein